MIRKDVHALIPVQTTIIQMQLLMMVPVYSLLVLMGVRIQLRDVWLVLAMNKQENVFSLLELKVLYVYLQYGTVHLLNYCLLGQACDDGDVFTFNDTCAPSLGGLNCLGTSICDEAIYEPYCRNTSTIPWDDQCTFLGFVSLT